MKIVVLNGSPKGQVSVTMQYVRFLEKKSPQHKFTILNVCHDSKQLEEDEGAFNAAIKTIQNADAVLWATPVYVFVVPGPYKRFIELVIERGVTTAFKGKYAVILTTSVHFFDHTAHAYLHGISEDFGMHVAGSHSAEMYDSAQARGAKTTGPVLGLLHEDRRRTIAHPASIRSVEGGTVVLQSRLIADKDSDWRQESRHRHRCPGRRQPSRHGRQGS